ncbi:MAG: hypothetical protein ACRD1V_07740 [Vicinamibacterales bacterium]
MHSPARAIARLFVRRHRWGLTALAVYFVVLGAIKATMLASGRAVVIRDAASFALVVVMPLTATFIYLLAVFSFGLEGDIAARQSMYPARMFTLPLTTDALAAWPMLYGSLGAAALWFATRLCAVWPSDVHVPIVWPALLAASLLAWTQALTWMPYPVRGLRVGVSVLWLAAVDTSVLMALHSDASEAVMLAFLAPHVPLAYATARWALARARRGDGVDESRRAAAATIAPHRSFRSPARAQFWFEWRRHGRSLPALVAMLLPFELLLLFAFRDTPALVLGSVLLVLVTPPFMAGFVAATVGRPGVRGSSMPGLSPFIATRPLTTASLVAAPMKATLVSTTAAWLLILVVIPLALTASGTWPAVVDRALRIEAFFGAPRATAIALLGVVGLFAWTWKRLVQGLYIGLTGRDWLIKANVFATLSLMAAAGVILGLAQRHAVLAWLWDGIPWILGGFATVKIGSAAWIVWRVFRDRLISDRALLLAAASWSAATFVLYSVLLWFVDTDYVPHFVLLLIAILAVPLARPLAAPLALAGNRHR